MSYTRNARPAVLAAIIGLLVILILLIGGGATALAAPSQPAPANDAAATHVVQPGESLSLLARCRATSVERIVSLNGNRFHGRSLDLINPGESLALPPAPAQLVAWRGLTLPFLAACTDTSPAVIKALNADEAASWQRGRIPAGQSVRLSGSSEPSPEAPGPDEVVPLPPPNPPIPAAPQPSSGDGLLLLLVIASGLGNVVALVSLAVRRRRHPKLSVTSHASSGPAGHPWRWPAFVALALGLFVVLVDTTIFAVALPDITKDLGASETERTWITDGYLIVFAALLLVFGMLSDRFGRTRVFLGGLVVLVAGALIAVDAASAGWVVIARAVMAVGAAMVMPATMAKIPILFPPGRERRFAMVAWGLVSVVALVAGPLCGGYLVLHHGWESVFWANIVVAGLTALVAIPWLPESKAKLVRGLDPIGMSLAPVGLVTMLAGVIEAPKRGWTSGGVVAAIAIGFLLGAGFVWWELRLARRFEAGRTKAEPMLDLRLFGNAAFSAPAASIAVLFAGVIPALFVVARYLQEILQWDALGAGAALLPAAGGMVVGTLASPLLAPRLGAKVAVTAGLVAMGTAMWLGALAVQHDDVGAVLWCLAIAGAGLGLATPVANEVMLDALPDGQQAVAVATRQTMQQVGPAWGVAIVASVMSTVGRERVEAGDHLRTAFIEAMSIALKLTAAVVCVGALVAGLWMPGRDSQSPRAVGSVPRKDRPYLRGKLAMMAAFAAVIVTALLLGRAHGGLASTAALVYGGGLVGLFYVNTRYHVVQDSQTARMQRVDHGIVFVFIAATYTPFGLYGLDRWYCVAMLSCVWLGAAAGFVAKMRGFRASPWGWNVLYMLMGGLPLLTIWLLHGALGLWPVLLVTGGNAVFLVGGYIFAEERPVLWPRWFGFHELFHLLVVAAVAMHAMAIDSVITRIG